MLVPSLTVILSVEPPDSGHCPILKPSPTIYLQHSHTCLNTACSSLIQAVFSSLRPVPLPPELASFLLVSGPVLGHLVQKLSLITSCFLRPRGLPSGLRLSLDVEKHTKTRNVFVLPRSPLRAVTPGLCPPIPDSRPSHNKKECDPWESLG